MADDGIPPALDWWHDRIARFVQPSSDGYLLLEAVVCHCHGADPVPELEWTVRLSRDGVVQYDGGIRLDWVDALDELSSGICPWLDPPAAIEWLSRADAGAIRYRYFD